MRRQPLLALAVILAAGALLTGCNDDEVEVSRGRAPEISNKPAPSPPSTPMPTRTRVPPPSPTPRTSAVPAGYAVIETSQPTGSKSDSVIHIQKTAPSEVLVGKEFDYKITLTNLTKVALEDVTLAAMLPSNFRPTKTAPDARMQAGKAIWSVGLLAGGESRTFAVYGSAISVGELSYCSEVTYKMPQDCLAIRAVQPALKLVKTAPAEALVCDMVTSTITVTNTGTGTARGVRIVDRMAEGMMTPQGQDEAVMEVGSLMPGQSRQYEVTAKASKPGNYTNTVAATAEDGLSAQASATTVIRQPVLTLTKTGPQHRYVGRPVTYAIKVTNTGDGEARNTVVTETIPSGVSVDGATEGAKKSGSQVVWQLGTLAPGTSKDLAIRMTAASPGTITNVVVAKAHCAEASAEASTEIRGIPAILLETIDVEDPIEVGANETYVITITNQGSAVGTGIRLVCTLASQQSYVSATGPTEASAEQQTVSFSPLASLAPKAKATYRVVVKGVSAGDVRFRVSLTSDQIREPVEETESTNIYE